MTSCPFFFFLFAITCYTIYNTNVSLTNTIMITVNTARVRRLLLMANDETFPVAFSILMGKKKFRYRDMVAWLACLSAEFLEELYEDIYNGSSSNTGALLEVIWEAMQEQDVFFGEEHPVYDAYRDLEKEFISSHKYHG